MEAAHSVASCMGGVRTTGDMVMRLQLSKKMRINDAKQYIANKLGLTIEEICDVVTMSEVREERKFGLGHQEPCTESPTAMEAKFRIAEALDIRINSVERFKEQAGIK